jgi:hypothetical protein
MLCGRNRAGCIATDAFTDAASLGTDATVLVLTRVPRALFALLTWLFFYMSLALASLKAN